MTLIELLKKFADGETSAIDTIHQVSSMFNPAYAVDLLSVICQIARVEKGEMNMRTFKKVYSLD